MGFGYTNFYNGLEIVAKPSATSNTLGDLEVLTSTNKLYFYNGSINDAVVTENDVATLTNKSMSGTQNTFTNLPNSAFTNSFVQRDGTTPLTGNWNAGSFSITANSVILGSTTNTISGLSTVINGGGTLTLPSTSDTLVGRATTDTLTNKTLSGNQASNFANGLAIITLPTVTGTLATLAGTETLTNKTLTGNIAVNLMSGAATITLPTVTGTLATLAGVETFSNKTFSNDITIAQIATPSNPPSGFDAIYFKSDNQLYTLTSTGTETRISAGSGVTNAVPPRFTLSGETIPGFICIDGAYAVQTANTISSMWISMLDSGNSGSTVVRLNQWRSGTLFNSATASMPASGDQPASNNCALSGSLTVALGDTLTCDIVSVAGGTPSELSAQPVFT